jgi:HK97 gp10 family phage protein
MGLSNTKRAMTRLRKIPPAIRKSQRVEILAAARDLVAAQKAVAPVDDGTLRDSIRLEDASSADRIAIKVKAGGPTTTKSVRAGVQASYDYAMGAEFGTSVTPAQPFFYGPYRARRKQFRRKRDKAAREAIKGAVT